MPSNGAFTIHAGESDDGKRLDTVVASHLSDCSRSFAARLIQNDRVQVNDQIKKSGYRVRAGDEIRGFIPPPEPIKFMPEPVPLNILYEDAHLMIINKPAGLVVHPAPGNYSGTLVNGVLYHCPQLGGIGGQLRPGIVHRLDKNTTGTLVVAKTASAHEKLARQFKQRKVQKQYLALVYGRMETASGIIELPIGRHPVDRKRMSITTRKAREAVTRWRVQEQFCQAALLEVDLKTGRTHQIRVHCAAIDHPIVGDAVYRRRRFEKKDRKKRSDVQAAIADLLSRVSRQMLHAWRLGFHHPVSGEWMSFESPLPEDMTELIDKLRKMC